jgi:hypothetical protein
LYTPCVLGAPYAGFLIKLHFLIKKDVWGPSPTLFINGNRYYVSFIDAFSWFTWVFPIRLKSDVMSVFIKFQTTIERLLNSKIKSVQTD